MKLLALALTLGMSFNTLAGEADHYTRRGEPLKDMAGTINLKANQLLRDSVNKANLLSSCNQSIDSELSLYEILTESFANHSKGELVKYVLHSEEVERRMIPLKQSIYGDWKILNGYLMGKKSAAASPLALTPMIRLGEEVVGTDKLEHMFGMGLIYFKKHYVKGQSLKRVLKHGIIREKTFLGGNILATGVFAYSDLSANFNGMRFWNHMLQKRDDVLGKSQNLGPYVKCQAGKWQVVESNPIDFTNYVDPSMDESINCSKFATKAGVRKFKKQLKSKAVDNEQLKCPMSVSKLKDMNEKYNTIIEADKAKRPISHWILNDDGTEDVSYLNEF